MALRGIFRSLMDRTVTHQRNVPTTDAVGGPVAAWTAVHSSVACSIWPIDTQVAMDYEQRQIRVTHAVCTDTDLAAKPADRILDGSCVYVVMGLEPYSNTKILGRPLYVMHCDRRTV